MKIKLPIVIDRFDDYHEIPVAAYTIKKIIPSIKYEELGFLGHTYIAIFYTKKDTAYKKLRAKYMKLLNEQTHIDF
jgi:hypothetical protein